MNKKKFPIYCIRHFKAILSWLYVRLNRMLWLFSVLAGPNLILLWKWLLWFVQHENATFKLMRLEIQYFFNHSEQRMSFLSKNFILFAISALKSFCIFILMNLDQQYLLQYKIKMSRTRNLEHIVSNFSRQYLVGNKQYLTKYHQCLWSHLDLV